MINEVRAVGRWSQREGSVPRKMESTLFDVKGALGTGLTWESSEVVFLVFAVLLCVRCLWIHEHPLGHRQTVRHLISSPRVRDFK